MPVIPRAIFADKPRFHRTNSVQGKTYIAETEQNPDTIGNEQSRVGFEFNCYKHPIGLFFQNKVKISMIETISRCHGILSDSYQFEGNLKILHDAFEASIRENVRNEGEVERKQKFMLEALDVFIYAILNQKKLEKILHNPAVKTAISFCHGWIKRVYRKDTHGKTAYLYEDERLQAISNYLKIAISETFEKPETALKVVDIVVFLMKVDIYYRPRWIIILQEISPTVHKAAEESYYPLLRVLKGLCDICEPMTLTVYEQLNVEEYH